MRFFITGDVHFPIDWPKIYDWNAKVKPTAEDVLIICGDAGFLWNGSKSEHQDIDRIYKQYPFTILFVDGNHENFELLNERKKVPMFGSEVGRVSDNIFHLLRGRTYDFNGAKVFTMGGAVSIDKYMRTEGKSWWAQEVPSREEQEFAVSTLDTIGNEVDYIITHAGPQDIITQLSRYYEGDEVTHYLNFIKNNTSYKKWYFGHYHLDIQPDDKHICLYHDIIPFGEDLK
jgi:hypothetical protein